MYDDLLSLQQNDFPQQAVSSSLTLLSKTSNKEPSVLLCFVRGLVVLVVVGVSHGLLVVVVLLVCWCRILFATLLSFRLYILLVKKSILALNWTLLVAISVEMRRVL